jgi:hypothetical protein
VINQGNSQARYRVEGNDDDRACSFEFQSPGDNVRLANQADFRLAPDTTAILPVFISARKRRLVGLRSQRCNSRLPPLRWRGPSRRAL